MKYIRFIIAFICLVLCRHVSAQTNDIDTELSNLAGNLAGQIESQSKKKVAVIDFTDLDGGTSELGKYIAEQLTVDLVIVRKDFSVLDRANLKKILDEHKLTATGLVDPDNAKKLGQFAGVDALILGTITPKNQNISLTAKIITTDTAEIVGAVRTEFKMDNTVQNLMTKPATDSLATDDAVSSNDGDKVVNLNDDKPQVVKSFGDLRVEVGSLKVVENDEYLLTMTLTNQSSKKSIWVALNSDSAGILTDSGGFEYRTDIYSVSGIQVGRQLKSFYGNADDSNNRFNPATEISPNDSIPVTVKFAGSNRQPARAGICNLQMEILLGHGFDQSAVTVSTKNLMTKLLAQ
jgi:curli biogenesis system outer membrane secretion channel CsgG